MAALDEVLDRLRTDDAYRTAVARDPSICLREHALGPDEMATIEDAAREAEPSPPHRDHGRAPGAGHHRSLPGGAG